MRLGRDAEGLAVHLGVRDDERVRDALRDRVVLVDDPDALLLPDLAPAQRAVRAEHAAEDAPAQRAVRAEHAAEDLGVVAGVQDDEAHALQDAFLDAVDERVLDLVVAAVAPPEEHVGLLQQVLREPLLRHVEGDGRDLEIVGGEALGEGVVDAVGVEGADQVGPGAFLLLVDVLVPDGDADLAHGESVGWGSGGMRRMIHPFRPSAQATSWFVGFDGRASRFRLTGGGAEG